MSLAHLRIAAANSRGRRFPEAPHPLRNDFQRDRDRVVHSRAFRRLEDKTQVFPSGISDHFRTRLTHTLEVSQISRTIALALGLDSDLTEALALAHDLGHPPFAHAGERTLNRLMQEFGADFEHNRQALRIVERLEHRYARYAGLNLTFEVREGIVKHSRDFGPGEFPELDEYLPGQRPPLEAQLIDLADEIAYNTADLDDAYAAGLLSYDDLAGLHAETTETVETSYPAAGEKVRVAEIVRRLLDSLAAGLVAGTRQAAEASGAASVGDVRLHPDRLARFTESAAILNASLKQFLHRRVYASPQLEEERQRSMSAVERLFRFYLEHPDRLPASFREEMEGEPLHQIICDYVSGMTEGYFRRTYRAYFD